MTTLELWINRHNRRLMIGLFLKRAGEWLAAWLYLFGACVLTVKLFLPDFWPEVLWLGLLVIPILGLAARYAIRSPFSRTEAVALLDRQLKGGGLIMSLAEDDDPAWHDKLPQTPDLWKRKLPKIRPVRFFRLIGWPMAFALGALLIPTNNPHPKSGFSPSVGQEAVQQLETLHGLLEVSGVVNPEESKEIKTVLEQLAEDTEEKPLTSEKWETIDSLRKTFDEKLTKDEAQLADAAQKVAKLLEGNEDKIAELLPKDQADWDKVTQVMKNLSDRGVLPEMPGSMGPQMQQLLRQGSVKLAEDPELRGQVLTQVQQLLKNRSLNLQNVRTQFDDVFAQQLSRFARASKKEVPDSADPESLGSATKKGTGGKLKWGEVSQDVQSKFKQVVLPPGFLDDPTNPVAGITPGQRNPRTVAPSENVSPDLPTEFQAATGGEVRTRELRPRHRSVVKKYFQREGESEPAKANLPLDSQMESQSKPQPAGE